MQICGERWVKRSPEESTRIHAAGPATAADGVIVLTVGSARLRLEGSVDPATLAQVLARLRDAQVTDAIHRYATGSAGTYISIRSKTAVFAHLIWCYLLLLLFG